MPFKNTYDIILLCPFSLNFDQALQLSIAFVGCPKLGFYGESCSMLYACSKNCFCHITEWTCLGCLPGYYGQNCSLPCPQNCFCHRTKGTCLSCLPGYMGLNCNESKWYFKSFQRSAILLVFTYCSVAASDAKMIWLSVGR